MIKRQLIQEIKNHLKSREISLIVGPRQAGKTTLMKELLFFLKNQGKRTLYLNLDFEPDRMHFASQSALIAKIKLEFGSEESYVFIDEIQRKENAGLFLKGIYDQDLKCKFIISGSGSLELKEKIHESLAGRKRLFELSTLTFTEFVNHKTDYKYEGRLDQFFEIERSRTETIFNEYINFGGYPRVVLEETIKEKIMTIDEIFRSYVEKDISFLLRIEKSESFTKLLKILSSQLGRLLNISELASLSGISVPTLKNYLTYAEKTCVIRQITPYFSNRLKEITKSPVVYFSDIGLRNYMIGLFGNMENSSELGLTFQNFICKILYEKIRFTPTTLHYWRTTDKAEVDFVLNKCDTLIPIEVKYSNLKRPETGRSFHSFIEKYSPKEGIIANLSLDSEIRIRNTHVKFMPFYKLISHQF